MNNNFHKNLNRMALFTTVIICGVVLYRADFINIAITNVWLNGIIIGATLFGMLVCFAEMFRLMPEYNWLKKYFYQKKNIALPPTILRPVALVLQSSRPGIQIEASTAQNLLQSVIARFEDGRETVRYITNTLIFLGLLGTFWGLINTVGGFSELINVLDFNNPDTGAALQAGLAGPLAGMATAFTSSLFGLAGSLIVGFLGLQVQNAQNSIVYILEENLSRRTRLFTPNGMEHAAVQLSHAVNHLDETISKMEK